MAFASTITSSTVAGNKRLVFGTFTNGANDSGGAITTGLSAIDWFAPIVTSHVGATAIKHTISGGTATLVADDNVDGNWIAVGL